MSLSYRIGGYEFSGNEVRDLLIAWIVLGLAFAIFFAGGGPNLVLFVGSSLVILVFVSLLTAGIAFLLHELAHKVVAVRYGQVAEFRADYSMLFLALMSALLGFIFAAPGAVYHRGYLTDREHGHIAIAGPATNVALAAAFLPIFVLGVAIDSGVVELIGQYGVVINLFLAAFNMIPYGPLDGKTVIGWSKLVWVAFFVPSVILAILSILVLGLSFPADV